MHHGASVFFCYRLFLQEVTQWHRGKGGDDAENDNKCNELLYFHFLHRLKGY